MKKLMYLLVVLPLFVGCGSNDPEAKLTGTIWQKKSFYYDQKLEFLDGSRIKYTLNPITNGVETEDTTPTYITYNISSGKPLVDSESILIVSSSYYGYDGYKIYIYKDMLLWETKSPYDSSTDKDTYTKIQ